MSEEFGLASPVFSPDPLSVHVVILNRATRSSSLMTFVVAGSMAVIAYPEACPNDSVVGGN